MRKLFVTLLNSKTSRHTLTALTGNFFTVVLGILFTIFVARFLSPVKFGIYSVITTTAVIIASLADLGTASSLINFLPKSGTKKNKLIGLTLLFQLLIAGIVGSSIILLHPFWSRYLPDINFDKGVIAACLIMAFILNGFSQKVLKAQSHFAAVALIQVLDSLIKLAFVFALYFLFHSLSVINILRFSLIASLLTGILGLFIGVKEFQFSIDRKLIKTLFTFAKWGAIIEILTIALSKIDILLVASLSDSYQAGLLAAANRVSLVFNLLFATINSVVAPRFSSFSSVKRLRQYMSKLVILISLINLVLISLFFVSPLIIELIYGPSYSGAVSVFKLIVLSIIPASYAIITSNALIFTFNLPHFVAHAQILQLLLLLSLNLYFIPQFGSLGPAISALLANTFFLVFINIKFLGGLKRKIYLSNVRRLDSLDELPPPNLE